MTPEFISLGGGVQSITMALLAEHNLIIPRPTAAIFADTMWEPSYVYDQIEWLSGVVSFPVITVNHRDLKADTVGLREIRIPAFTSGGGIIGRQCTRDYKVRPVTKEIRKALGLSWTGRPKRGVSAKVWLGISTDEARRTSNPWVKYIEHRYPLIENDMSREDCVSWLAEHDYPIPKKSACLGCPFTSDKRWAELKFNYPDEWKETVEVDAALRKSTDRQLNSSIYLHRSCVPLDEVDFGDEEDMHGLCGECAGVCGV